MATHILVVDDETAIADLVEVYLKNEGFTIHKFYNACRVRCDGKTLMNARFALCMAVKQALSNVLSLVKITAPDAM